MQKRFLNILTRWVLDCQTPPSTTGFWPNAFAGVEKLIDKIGLGTHTPGHAETLRANLKMYAHRASRESSLPALFIKAVHAVMAVAVATCSPPTFANDSSPTSHLRR